MTFIKNVVADDLFSIQIRLFRLFQLTEKISVEKAEAIFTKYNVFDYIATCYEEYHVQGDDTNLTDIERYLKNKGWNK